MPIFKTLLILAGLLFLAKSGRSSDTQIPPRPEHDFAWFDGLDLIDLTAPFGFVRTPSQTAKETTYRSYPAFLIRRPVAGEWTAQTLGLSVWRGTAKEDPYFKGYPIKFEEFPLREYAARRLGAAYNRRDEDPFIKPISEHLELFILAAACWKQGATEEAEALYAKAVQLAKPEAGNAPSFHARIVDELALRRYWMAINEAGQPAIPRAEWRRHFEEVASQFPDTKHGKLAGEWCTTLDRMEREDKSHPKIADADLDQLPVERQVSEWIYRLRDQNGQQYAQPGRCDVFGEMFLRGKGATPAHRLARLGFAAVPQLIEALDDSTPSRSLGYGRSFYFSHTVLTVGDCAEAILSRVAGEEFFPLDGRSSDYLSTSGTIAETKQRVLAWWEQSGDDELGWLKRAILRGDPSSVRKAHRLLQRFPESAPEAIMQAITATADGEVRANLVRTLINSGPEIAEFLLRETEGPGPLNARVEAARFLRMRGDLRGEEVLLAHWKEIVAARRFNTVEGRWQLAYFLGGSASVEVIHALHEAMSHLGAADRRALLPCIAHSLPIDRLVEKSVASADAAREAVLVKSLADKARVYGRNENGLHDPRVCDDAARFLAAGFPDRYRYRWGASQDERDEMIFQMQASWRAAHALEPPSKPVDDRSLLPASAVNRITRVTFGENEAALPKVFLAQATALRGETFTLDLLFDLLAAHARLKPSETPRVGFEFIRGTQSRGISLRIEAIPGARRPEHECWNIAVLTWPPGAEPAHSGVFPRPGDARSEDQWTRSQEPVSAALSGELPLEIRGHLYDLKGGQE